MDVSSALAEALRALDECRPRDPLDFLSNWFSVKNGFSEAAYVKLLCNRSSESRAPTLLIEELLSDVEGSATRLRSICRECLLRCPTPLKPTLREDILSKLHRFSEPALSAVDGASILQIAVRIHDLLPLLQTIFDDLASSAGDRVPSDELCKRTIAALSPAVLGGLEEEMLKKELKRQGTISGTVDRSGYYSAVVDAIL